MSAASSKPKGGWKPTPPKKNRTPLVVGIAVAAVVVVAGIIAVVSTSSKKDSTSSSSGGKMENIIVEGASLAQYDRNVTPDPAVGKPAPWMTGQDFDGRNVRAVKDGRPKVLVFVAHWCPHCQNEVPVLVKWLQANPQPKVDVYAVVTGTDPTLPNYPPSAWLEREKWTSPILVDGDLAAANAFGLANYPYFVTVDANGLVQARRSGELPESEIAALFAAVAATGS